MTAGEAILVGIIFACAAVLLILIYVDEIHGGNR